MIVLDEVEVHLHRSRIVGHGEHYGGNKVGCLYENDQSPGKPRRPGTTLENPVVLQSNLGQGCLNSWIVKDRGQSS